MTMRLWILIFSFGRSVKTRVRILPYSSASSRSTTTSSVSECRATSPSIQLPARNVSSLDPSAHVFHLTLLAMLVGSGSSSGAAVPAQPAPAFVPPWGSSPPPNVVPGPAIAPVSPMDPAQPVQDVAPAVVSAPAFAPAAPVPAPVPLAPVPPAPAVVSAPAFELAAAPVPASVPPAPVPPAPAIASYPSPIPAADSGATWQPPPNNALTYTSYAGLLTTKAPAFYPSSEPPVVNTPVPAPAPVPPTPAYTPTPNVPSVSWPSQTAVVESVPSRLPTASLPSPTMASVSDRVTEAATAVHTSTLPESTSSDSESSSVSEESTKETTTTTTETTSTTTSTEVTVSTTTTTRGDTTHTTTTVGSDVPDLNSHSRAPEHIRCAVDAPSWSIDAENEHRIGLGVSHGHPDFSSQIHYDGRGNDWSRAPS
ncbi:MAG: hypothetical protein J3Q66DRAFT_392025 [Benniella sp.]|nr:MAG: hypothetical protein J3Q66DRAFT_392025 [Benniella sp.]